MFVRSVYENERGDNGVFMKLCVYGPLTRIPKICFLRVLIHRCVFMVCLCILHSVYGVFVFMVCVSNLHCVYIVFMVKDRVAYKSSHGLST